jgi:hypothetical protein
MVRYIDHMKREIDYKRLEKWVERVGGIQNATTLICKRLECSLSKAEKLAGTRYPSMILPAEQVALSELTCIPRDALFPFVTAKGRAS